MRFRPLAPLFLLLGCAHSGVPLPALSPAAATSATIARGEYIVRNVAVCGQCHAADRKDPDGPLSGGAEFRDWRIGVARASNLTPDSDTGLGTWTEEEIVRALRSGVRKDGRLLAPVMPYEWFHDMSDEDALSVARYLKSLPPVHREVTQNPNFIFKLGKLLFLRPKSALSVTAPPRGVTPEYGSYLAQHAGLCAECHTQRTGIKSEPDKTKLLGGMEHPPKDFPVKPTNLTPDSQSGIGSWREADFLNVIRTGTALDGKPLDPFMPWRQIRRMSDDDLRAINAFLHTLKPIRNDAAPAR